MVRSKSVLVFGVNMVIKDGEGTKGCTIFALGIGTPYLLNKIYL